MKPSSCYTWNELQRKVKSHTRKTGIPFHLWIMSAMKKTTKQATTKKAPVVEDLHQEFRDELLS